MVFKFNDRFLDELSVSPPVEALVVAAAQRVAARARATAPAQSGNYARGIVVRSKFQKRAVALVVATDPKSMLVESKTGNLARALRAERRRG